MMDGTYIPCNTTPFWELHGCIEVIPYSSVRNYFCWCLKGHMGCWSLNLDQLHAKHKSYLLYYDSGPRPLYFVGGASQEKLSVPS